MAQQLSPMRILIDNNVEEYILTEAHKTACDALADAPETYFNLSSRAKLIAIADLVLSRARTEGVLSAANRMRSASLGGPRREPISVRVFGKGDYLVVDGNSTTIAMAAAGYQKIWAERLSEGEVEN
ncbi:MAG: hypothetical protein ACSHXB_19310 [Sulfitobacter sp.]